MNSTQLRAEIDTDADPLLPFGNDKENAGIRILNHQKIGKVIIERRGEDLFIDGMNAVLHVHSHASRRFVGAGELLTELSGKRFPNACVLDFLAEHPEFIPDSWRPKSPSDIDWILFFGTEYQLDDGDTAWRHLGLRQGGEIVPGGMTRPRGNHDGTGKPAIVLEPVS